MNTIPITYLPGWINPTLASAVFEDLKNGLDWVRHDKVPRSEYYASATERWYTYGTPPHARTYQPQEWTDALQALKFWVEKEAGCKFDVVFLNRYHDQSDQLGWHSDDSPEMDDARPIAIISLGVEREILFREIATGATPVPETRLRLEHGSLCLMAAGMQDTHQHRIPKAGFQCGERISLTFRGLAS